MGHCMTNQRAFSVKVRKHVGMLYGRRKNGCGILRTFSTRVLVLVQSCQRTCLGVQHKKKCTPDGHCDNIAAETVKEFVKSTGVSKFHQEAYRSVMKDMQLSTSTAQTVAVECWWYLHMLWAIWNGLENEGPANDSSDKGN